MSAISQKSRDAKRLRADAEFQALADDIEWLLRANTWPPDIVARVGYAGKPQTLERRLQRRGRHDLSNALQLSNGALHGYQD